MLVFRMPDTNAKSDLPLAGFEKLWRRLKQIGLNAYEARSYLVLVGHPRFKALELAARSHVPRQKIYEVLDSLIEKGFAEQFSGATRMQFRPSGVICEIDVPLAAIQ